jgi:predicted DNA-binding protein
MAVSAPLKSATYLLRISPEDKKRLEQMAEERDITLAHALREGARLYLEDWSRCEDQERAAAA